MVPIWQVLAAVEEAIETLDHASHLAARASGSDGGRAPNPEYGDPGQEPVEGWPAMDALADALGKLAEQARHVVVDEIREAAKSERQEADRYDDSQY